MVYYVYRITNKEENKHYYGKRCCKSNPKQDLGVKYFSSSTNKDFLQDQRNFPNKYKYKVIKIFTDKEKATMLEIKLHGKFDVGNNHNFYNKCKQTAVGFDTTGVKLTEEHKKKISPKGRKHSLDTIEKLRAKSYKECLSEETRFKMGKANRGKNLPIETRIKLSQAKKGIPVHTDESKKLMSINRKGKGNARAKLVDVYTYPDNNLIASSIVCAEWCKDTKYVSSMLLQTLKRDENKPYCFSVKNEKYNPLHYKGLYVKFSTFS